MGGARRRSLSSDSSSSGSSRHYRPRNKLKRRSTNERRHPSPRPLSPATPPRGGRSEIRSLNTSVGTRTSKRKRWSEGAQEKTFSPIGDSPRIRSVVQSDVVASSSPTTYESRIQKMEQLIETLTKAGGQSDSHRLAVRSDCIPEFDPENDNLSASQWVSKIDQIKCVNNWDDVTTVYHMQSRLAGMARNWYHGLASYSHTWEEWKHLIQKTFPDHVDFATALKKMTNKVKMPSESMTTYYFEKMELLRTCQIQGRNAVSCLIDGLSSVTIQHGARAGRYSTPETLYEEYLSTFREEKQPSPRSTIVTDRGRDKLSDLRERIKVGARYPRRQEEGSAGGVRCFNCGQRGHMQSRCPKPRVGESQIVLKLTTDNDANACYFVDCVVNGKPLRGYVDTGCAAVTIRRSDAETLSLERVPVKIRLSGFAGGFVLIDCQVHVKLEVDLASVKVTALMKLAMCISI